ncbi:hypothetical protein COCNU_scaffold001181G000050 [Cocos nucifera]|nr:hypothetical protein [Cocos nucifera]
MDRAALQTGGWRDARQVCSAPARGTGPCGDGAPYHPDGASRIAPPRGFQRIERHCKRAGGGMRVRCAARPHVGLGRAATVPPTTPTGHPGKSHPGGSKGSSGIANGWEPRCASHGHGDWDLRSEVPNPLWAHPHAAVAPPNTPTGHPGNPNPGGSKGPSDVANWWGGQAVRTSAEQRGWASAVRQRRPLPPRGGILASPTPGVPRDRAALRTGWWRDARPVGMALGTCAEWTRIPGQPTAARTRAWQTGARMVRQRAGKLGTGPAHCGGAAQNVRR